MKLFVNHMFGSAALEVARSPNTIANCFMALPQLNTAYTDLASTFRSAIRSSLMAASSLGYSGRSS